MPLALPRGTAQSPAPAESHRRRQAGKLAGSLIPPRRVARQVILPPHAILGTCSAVTPRPNKHRERIEIRTPRLFLGVFALALILLCLLLACGGSDELADGPSSEPTTAKEEGVPWIFKEPLPLFDTSLIRRFPTVNWERVTYLLYWSLRISVFALLALLLIVSRIRKSRRPAGADYPQVPEGLTTLPSDLPAPAVSVLASRKVGPKTYLSILVDMFQKGNLTITGGYGESVKSRLQSRVGFTRQFEPDQPWEKEVYSALPFLSASDLLKPNSDMLKSKFNGRRKAISTHLDECLQSRGIFDEPPLQVMADRGQGWVARTAWVLATVILAVGVGLWVNFWLPWWAGAAIGIPIAVVFLDYAFDATSGRLNPTPAGALEISQWWSFAGSIRDGLVSPSLDPSQPDPMLPYAVALNEARQWVSNINALPPWFLPDGPREQTRRGLYVAYRGFIGADSWDLDGGPKKKSTPLRDWWAQLSAGKLQGGWSGPGGDAAGDGGG